MSVAVEISHLTKNFGKVKALDDVCLTIEKGEMFAIMGADGAGRTTLFRLMTTLLLPDGGGVTVEGLDIVKDYAAIRDIIGYMPGRFSLYGDLSVEENLKFFADMHNVSIDENRYLIDDIYSQIEPFKARKAAKLSGGMKQKLALSCALIHAPKVLFLDEPTTGIDPVSRKELWAMLKKLGSKGITIIASTPYLDEIRVCDRACLLENGKVKRVASSGEIADMFEGHLESRNAEQIMSAPTVIEIDGLTKRFGDFTAVDHISFDVHKGEIFGFLGANGAGKTTAMRILCGLSLPTEGKGSVMGFDILRDAELIKKNIGYMSQKFALYDDLTVLENMRLFAGIYGVHESEILGRSMALLEKMNFADQKDRIVGKLPLGWKQRLAFAVSLIHNPEVVFLDEPTGGVDPQARRDFWKMIYEQSASQGTTFFVTTHYMDEAEYCDRISIMVDGRVEALGAPEDLVAQYHASGIDEVFHLLARKAQRGDD